MTIELPALVIYPDGYGTSRPNGLPAPFPAAMIGRAIEERSTAYAKGHWREMLSSHVKRMRTNTPIPYGLDGFITGDFKVVSAADAAMCINPNLSVREAWRIGIKAGAQIKNLDELAVPVEFSGGLFTPFKAIIHWVVGKGQQAKVNINKLGITPSPQKIPALKAAIDGAVIGISRIDITAPYNTGMDSQISRIYLGSITLRIQGDVIKGADGGVSFNGTARAFSDKYDANASSHRGGFDEGATTALREIGRVANAQDYEILIHDQMPINFQQ